MKKSKTFITLLTVFVLSIMMSMNAMASENDVQVITFGNSDKNANTTTNSYVQSYDTALKTGAVGSFFGVGADLKLESINGKAKLKVDGKEIALSNVAAYGFIDGDTKTVYLQLSDNKWYWYNYYYQGSDNVVLQPAMSDANGSVIMLSEEEIKEKLGIKNDNTVTSVSSSSANTTLPPRLDSISDNTTEEQNEEVVKKETKKNEIKFIDTTIELDWAKVKFSIDGVEKAYIVKTGDHGYVYSAGIDKNMTIWVLYQSGLLYAWNKDVVANKLIRVTDSCTKLKTGENGLITGYLNSGNKDVQPILTKDQLKAIVAKQRIVCVSNVLNDRNLMKNNTFVDSFTFVDDKTINYNKKRYRKVDQASFTEEGTLLYRKGKNVYEITKNKRGKNVKTKVAKNVTEIHLDPNTGIADYIELKNGKKLDAVTRQETIFIPNPN